MVQFSGSDFWEDKLRELYFMHYKMVVKVAYSILGSTEAAEDVASDVFLKLIEKIKYKDDIQNAQAWLCLVAKTTSYDHIKKQRLHVSLDFVDDILKSPDFTSNVHMKLYARTVLDELKDKNQKWYDVFLMRHLLGFSVREIAEYYHCSETAISNILYKTRKYLSQNDDSAGSTVYLSLLFLFLMSRYFYID